MWSFTKIILLSLQSFNFSKPDAKPASFDIFYLICKRTGASAYTLMDQDTVCDLTRTHTPVPSRLVFLQYHRYRGCNSSGRGMGSMYTYKCCSLPLNAKGTLWQDDNCSECDCSASTLRENNSKSRVWTYLALGTVRPRLLQMGPFNVELLNTHGTTSPALRRCDCRLAGCSGCGSE